MGITSPPLVMADVTVILAQIPYVIKDLKEKLKWKTSPPTPYT